ncbi:hypothetical protein ASPZODRAFT_147052 [Penicilliopsis zonata CBS 506.65]|uniref:Uncharacterized protein n=1 Tax=Penicilliopsis zonata CBS 506.65 TaxID=1073090 RepID=A0A1L9S645_9EURO|nr:hypothetical protein ASPZODRAFT_147052 [Penicilliopsis zonata CBS 506.65]OJJ42639.1 hypothetical protein ASPZODRAFT_147052 [Penicilliopsis zonata CBS 506.65]
MAYGYDGGTFDTFDTTSCQFWVDYTLKVAGENAFGGELCNNAGDATYNWSDTSALCDPEGLATYIKTMKIAYFEYPLEELFENTTNPTTVECIAEIQRALLEWN